MDTVRASTLVAMACLFAIGCVVGLIAGSVRRRRTIRFGLIHKPQKSSPVVLVPPGPVPRLIPGDSPNATRARQSHAQVLRQTPANATGAGMVDYIAAFAGPEKTEGKPIDYLLEP